MKLITVFLLIICCTVHLSANDNDILQQAWKEIENTNYSKAEELLKKATLSNETSLRGHLGLMYLYSFQRRYSEAERSYESVLQKAANPYPYYYGGLYKNFSQTIQLDDESFANLLKKMVDDENAPGILRASSAELYALTATKKGELNTAKEYFAKVGAIEEWTLIGPFDNAGGSGYDKKYPPETEFNSGAKYPALNGIEAEWFVPPVHRRDKWVDFTRYFPYYEAAFYAVSFVYSEQEKNAQVRVGTSGAMKTWFNDNLVITEPEETNNDVDTYIAPVLLKKGWNKILVKVCNSDLGRVNFLARLTNEKGVPLSGLKYSTGKQAYTAETKPPLPTLPNEFQEFLRDYVQKNPLHVEHTLLLADSYLRNEQSEKAELVLRDAIKNSPKSPLLLEAMIAVYSRNKKYDEISTTLETIATVDSTIPTAIEYHFRDYLKNDQFDRADYLLEIVKQQSPESERYYEYAIDLALARKSDQLLPLMKDAFARFPNSLRFATMQAIYISQTQNDTEGAIEIFNRLLKKNYTADLLMLISNQQLKNAKTLDSWLETYGKLLELEPASPGFYSLIAAQYSKREMFDKAVEQLQKALEFCPKCGRLYEQIGEAYRNMQNKEKALENYRKALKLYPFDFENRTVVRDMEGKKPLFTVLPSYNTDSIIKAAPPKSAYPNDAVVVLLDDKLSIIHPEGGSESLNTFIVKILNKQGIDSYKELQLSGYIEKAIVIKPNGTQVKADISDEGEVVFKTLEENDIVMVKWKNQYIEGGYFLNHYYETNYFETSHPILMTRFAVVAPDDYKMTIKTQFMTDTPEKRPTELGTMYSWVLTNVPAVKTEAEMPSWEEVGKWVKISTVPSWKDLADWYGEITRSKLKTSYEIKEKTAELLGAEKLSDDEKIKRIYEFITSKIRYSSVPFRQNGWVPQKARDVLITQIGDCKDVATLGIAMLGEAGIKADYVLVNTDVKALNIQLPTPNFDHCIASVETKKGRRYLDFTAHHYAVSSIPSNDLDVMCLQIGSNNVSGLFSLERNNFDRTNRAVNSTVGVTDDMKLSIYQKSSFTGTMAASYRSAFYEQGYDEVKKMVVEYFGSTFPSLELDTVWMQNMEERDSLFTEHVRYSVPNFISEMGSYKMLQVPWVYALHPDESVSYKERKFPLEYDYLTDNTHEKIAITLPPNTEPMELVPLTTFTSPIADYECKRTFSKGVLTLERSYKIKKRSASVQQYQEVKEFINNVVREDDKRILIGAAKPAAPAKKGKK